jgi:hypothetical protein
MSLYANYLTERTNDKILEGQTGFITYRYINDGKSIYLVDIYVVPENRRKGAAKMLADLVVAEAKAAGCTEIFGTVVPATNNSTMSLKVLLSYGMELHSSLDNMIIFRKEI